MALVKRAQLRNIHVFNVGARANGGPTVAMPGVGGVRHALGQCLKRVVFTYFEFAAHHRHFAVQIGPCNDAVHHGIRMPTNVPVQRWLAGCKGGKVVSAVRAGGAVESEATSAEFELWVGDGRRALEHHVLQQMRHAGFAIALMPRAHHVGQVYSDAVICRVGCEQNLEAVGKPVFGNALDGLHLGNARHRRRAAGSRLLRPDRGRQHAGQPPDQQKGQ